MTCDHCAKSIEKKLEGSNGLESKRVSYPEHSGAFTFDNEKLNKDSIIEIINSTGHYKVVNEIIENNGNSNSTANINTESATSDVLNSNYDYDLIIIGGGSAAFSASIKASSLEKKVLMINDGLPIGGSCVNVGCVPSKTLIRNAEQLYNSNHPNFTGINSGNNVLNFKEAIRQKTELVEELRQGKYIDVLKDDENVTMIRGRAELIDNKKISVGNDSYSALNILISTGSSTYIPDIPGLKDVEYLTNETLYDLEELPEHLIVLGGRYIALENAQLFVRLGAKVTILQRSNRIVPNEMPDVSEQLKEYLKEENLDVKTGVKIKSVEQRENKIKIVAVVNDEEEIIEGSHLFVATGRKGNAGNFAGKGVEVFGNSFIKTNDYLQTSIPNIYAAGDITGEYLFVYSAAYEGSLAVSNMFGENPTKKDFSVIPWVIFTDPQIAGVGMDENQASESKIDYDVSTIQLKDVPRSLAARNTKGFIKLLRNKETDQLIGARILAPEGSELLMEISLAIKYGITVTALKNMFHPYLTLSEGVKIAAINFEKDVRKLSCCAV
jgi:mercuric reductase